MPIGWFSKKKKTVTEERNSHGVSKREHFIIYKWVRSIQKKD